MKCLFLDIDSFMNYLCSFEASEISMLAFSEQNGSCWMRTKPAGVGTVQKKEGFKF